MAVSLPVCVLPPVFSLPPALAAAAVPLVQGALEEEAFCVLRVSQSPAARQVRVAAPSAELLPDDYLAAMPVDARLGAAFPYDCWVPAGSAPAGSPQDGCSVEDDSPQAGGSSAARGFAPGDCSVGRQADVHSARAVLAAGCSAAPDSVPADCSAGRRADVHSARAALAADCSVQVGLAAVGSPQADCLVAAEADGSSALVDCSVPSVPEPRDSDLVVELAAGSRDC